MRLGITLGTVVATVKHPSLTGVKLLLLQPVDESLASVDDIIVAADGVGVARGELVYWEGGPEASLALAETFAPVDAAIVGIADSVNLREGRRLTRPR